MWAGECPMGIEKQHLTAEDLLQLPTGMGERYELIEGELRVMSPAGPIHGKVANEISRQISNYVVEHQLGETFTAETGYYIRRKPDTVRAPDFSFISTDRLPKEGLPEKGYMPVMPDFVVEVVSPNDGAEEIEEKNLLWLNVGV